MVIVEALPVPQATVKFSDYTSPLSKLLKSFERVPSQIWLFSSSYLQVQRSTQYQSLDGTLSSFVPPTKLTLSSKRTRS